MRLAAVGLVLVLIVSGGHLVFLPLFFVLPLGGFLGRRGRGRR